MTCPTTPDQTPPPFAALSPSAQRLFGDELDPALNEFRAFLETRISGVHQSPEFTTAAYENHTSKRGPLNFTRADALGYRDLRRRALRSPSRTHSQTVLYEEALHRVAPAFGRDVALSQLQFLAEIISGNVDWCDERSTLSLLPRSSPLPYLPGDLTILNFHHNDDAAPGKADYIYLEHPLLPEQFWTGQRELDKANDVWDEILKAGVLGQQGSLALIEDIRRAVEQNYPQARSV